MRMSTWYLSSFKEKSVKKNQPDEFPVARGKAAYLIYLPTGMVKLLHNKGMLIKYMFHSLLHNMLFVNPLCLHLLNYWANFLFVNKAEQCIHRGAAKGDPVYSTWVRQTVKVAFTGPLHRALCPLAFQLLVNCLSKPFCSRNHL